MSRNVFVSGLGALFFVSGGASLIYQITWQRTLAVAFGSNLESSILVVSLFMFGLGMGSLFGGELSTRFKTRRIQIFFLCEVVAGVFGLLSIEAIRTLGELQTSLPLPLAIAVTCAVLLIPTLAMGATLPVLVEELQSRRPDLGSNLSWLYFSSTAGSAFVCFLTPLVLFRYSGQSAAVVFAAFCNFGVALLSVALHQKFPSQAPAVPQKSARPSRSRIPFGVILLLTALLGYCSLAHQILWLRIVTFATGGDSFAFAHVVGFFLTGIALGSLFFERMTRSGKWNLLHLIVGLLMTTSILSYLFLPIAARISTYGAFYGEAALYGLITILSFLSSGFFPLLSRESQGPRAAGKSVSLIYFASILGSSLAPVITGYFLLNVMTIEECIAFTALLIGGGSLLVFLVYGNVGRVHRLALPGVLFLILGAGVWAHEDLYSQTLERLHLKENFVKAARFKKVIQNRNGIVTVVPGKSDVLLGGGVYDGHFSPDPTVNSNMITRAYMIASLHPKPKRVLQIGLGSGSWLKVLSSYTNIDSIDVVELNPGYAKIIKDYPEIESVTRDQKIKIFTDDGRRWLMRNPLEKYDLIVMNTTWHWRNKVSHLLSREFLELAQEHLRPGGVLYYNTTFSKEAVRTAASVFKHVVRFHSFLAVSDSPFLLSPRERELNFVKFTNASERVGQELSSYELIDIGPEYRARTDLVLITDDNMASEFRELR